jgi:hypothetical protein
MLFTKKTKCSDFWCDHTGELEDNFAIYGENKFILSMKSNKAVECDGMQAEALMKFMHIFRQSIAQTKEM